MQVTIHREAVLDPLAMFAGSQERIYTDSRLALLFQEAAPTKPAK